LAEFTFHFSLCSLPFCSLERKETFSFDLTFLSSFCKLTGAAFLTFTKSFSKEKF